MYDICKQMLVKSPSRKCVDAQKTIERWIQKSEGSLCLQMIKQIVGFLEKAQTLGMIQTHCACERSLFKQYPAQSPGDPQGMVSLFPGRTPVYNMVAPLEEKGCQ